MKVSSFQCMGIINITLNNKLLAENCFLLQFYANLIILMFKLIKLQKLSIYLYVS